MAEEACCTCATLLSAIPPQYDEKTEKPIAHDRRLECCGRVICGRCIAVRITIVLTDCSLLADCAFILAKLPLRDLL